MKIGKRRSHVIFSGSHGIPPPLLGPSHSVKALVNFPVKVSGDGPTDGLERQPGMLSHEKMRAEERWSGWTPPKAGPIFSAIKEARSDRGEREIESRDSFIRSRSLSLILSLFFLFFLLFLYLTKPLSLALLQKT